MGLFVKWHQLKRLKLRPSQRAKSPCQKSLQKRLQCLRTKRLLQNQSKRPKKSRRKLLRELMAPESKKFVLRSTSEDQKPSDPPEIPNIQGNLLPPGIVWTLTILLSIL